MRRAPARDVAGLAGLFAASGVWHFVRPRHFELIVPRQLPRRRQLVYASGAAELLCAAGLVVPRTRRAAGVASAALLVAIVPANVQMAVDVCRTRGPLAQALVVLRLPMQLPLIRTAWRAGRDPAA